MRFLLPIIKKRGEKYEKAACRSACSGACPEHGRLCLRTRKGRREHRRSRACRSARGEAHRGRKGPQRGSARRGRDARRRAGRADRFRRLLHDRNADRDRQQVHGAESERHHSVQLRLLRHAQDADPERCRMRRVHFRRSEADEPARQGRLRRGQYRGSGFRSGGHPLQHP